MTRRALDAEAVQGPPNAQRWWFFLQGKPSDTLPRARNRSYVSVPVWLALSDGTVARGECVFNRDGSSPDWFLEGDDDGRPHRSTDVAVVAWAHVEPAPLYPKTPKG